MFGLVPAFTDGGGGGGGSVATGGGGGGGGTYVAPSSGGGYVAPSSYVAPGYVAPGSYVAPSSYVAPGVIAAPVSSGSFGPWGIGVYTPLDWPATRFVQDNERLDDLSAPRIAGAVDFRTLAIVAGLLFLATKL